MGEITLTIKVKLLLTDTQKTMLYETMQRYKDACNVVADYVYRTHYMSYKTIYKTFYDTLRDEYGLKAQQAQSVIKRVIAVYKTIQTQGNWRKPSFKHEQYELVWNRDYSIYKGRLMSVNTLLKRVKVPFSTKGFDHYMNPTRYRFGTAKLISHHGEYLLHIPVTYEVEDHEPEENSFIVGVDRGLRNIICTYDSRGMCSFVKGGYIKSRRQHYDKIRKELQQKHTSSARKRLKAIGHREHRWMQDVNHKISKNLVESYPTGTTFVLEDLTGIGESTAKVTKKRRREMQSWSFSDLEQKIAYKAKMRGSAVIKVDPRYTSQRCPICGYTDKKNRHRDLHQFICRCCGYQSDDDRIGAMNIMLKGKGKP